MGRFFLWTAMRDPSDGEARGFWICTGMLVWAVAVQGALAAGYMVALALDGRTWWPAAAAGMFWGATVWAVDRSVLAMDHTQPFARRLLTVAPRALLSIVASLVIVESLLLFLYAERIDERLAASREERITQVRGEARESVDADVAALDADLARLRAERDAAAAGVKVALDAYAAEAYGTAGSGIPGIGAVAAQRQQDLDAARAKEAAAGMALAAVEATAEAERRNLLDGALERPEVTAQIAAIERTDDVLARKAALDAIVEEEPGLAGDRNLLRALLLGVDILPLVLALFVPATQAELLARIRKDKMVSDARAWSDQSSLDSELLAHAAESHRRVARATITAQEKMELARISATGAARARIGPTARPAFRYLAAAVVLAIGAAALVVATGGDGSEEAAPSGTAELAPQTTIAAAETTVIPLGDGATLTVPPGAMAEGAVVTASTGTPPAGDYEAGARPVRQPVELTTSPPDAIKGPLTLEFPLGDRANPAAGIATLVDGRWESVPSTVDLERGVVSAQIEHFSWWNPFSWDWANIGASINQRIGEMVGKRAPAAACHRGQPQPSWVAQVVGVTNDPAVAVRGCVEGEGDVLAVELVNNRPYSLYLHYGAAVAWGWRQDGGSAVDRARNQLGDRLGGPGRLYLPPGGRASVGIPKVDGLKTFTIGYGWEAFAVDVLATTLGEIIERIPALDECAQTVFTYPFPTSPSPGAIRDAAESLFGCVHRGLAGAGYFDKDTVAQLEAYARGLSVAGFALKLGDYEWTLLDLFVDNFVIADTGLGAGFSLRPRTDLPAPMDTTTPPSPPAQAPPTPAAAPTSTAPAPAPSPPEQPAPPATAAPPTTQAPPRTPTEPAPPESAPPRTYMAQQGRRGADTFANPNNASGPGPRRVEPFEWVEVSCKVKPASTIPTANPDGYWYRLASSPWNDEYYAVANTFWNGDDPDAPPSEWTNNVDHNIPDC